MILVSDRRQSEETTPAVNEDKEEEDGEEAKIDDVVDEQEEKNAITNGQPDNLEEASETETDNTANRVSHLSLEGGGGPSEAGSVTLLRTLELTGQSRSQRVKVKSKGRSGRVDFADLHLVQQLTMAGASAVYALEFSLDGAFLAAGCDDGIIRVYEALSEGVLQQPNSTVDPNIRVAAIFSAEPVQCLEGHEGAVLSLSWSTNGFLLSGSADKTVRLWSPSRPDSLAVFPHADMVTAVAFHPADDRRFITGCFDCRIRLWNVEEKRVVAWNELPTANVVTAVAFSGGGRYALAGSSTGVLLFFQTEGFKYYTQILVKSSRGKNAVGKKISGIAVKPGSAMQLSPTSVSADSSGKRRVDDQTILVSSNDSRLRAYYLRDKSESAKYIGHVNESSQIPAGYSDDAEYILSGSEDGRCILWPADPPRGPFSSSSGHRRIESYDYFYAGSGTPCTAAVFAPAGLQGRLQAAGLRPVLPDGRPAEGRIIATADTAGRVRLFENNPLLSTWLSTT